MFESTDILSKLGALSHLERFGHYLFRTREALPHEQVGGAWSLVDVELSVGSTRCALLLTGLIVLVLYLSCGCVRLVASFPMMCQSLSNDVPCSRYVAQRVVVALVSVLGFALCESVSDLSESGRCAVCALLRAFK
jgi:hypothetical protein